MIAAATPTITDELHSLSDVGWYGSSYFLSAAVGYLVFRRVYVFCQCAVGFLLAIVIFIGGCTLCVRTSLIAGRALCGLGGAGILSGISEITVVMFPRRAQYICLVLVKLAFFIASTGSLVGGALAGSTWEVSFYVVSNVLEQYIFFPSACAAKRTL